MANHRSQVLLVDIWVALLPLVALHHLVATEEHHQVAMEVTGSAIGVLGDMMEEETEVVKTEVAERTEAVMTEAEMTVVMVVVGLEEAAVALMAAEVVLIKAATMEDPEAAAAAAVGIEDQDGMTSLSKKIPFSFLACRHLCQRMTFAHTLVPLV